MLGGQTIIGPFLISIGGKGIALTIFLFFVNFDQKQKNQQENSSYDFAETIDEDESLSLQDKEFEMIKKSLDRNSGKRKLAAQELGISERTLYRKIKQYDL